MNLIIGLVVVFGMVFGGFVLAGGKFDIILHALPFEGMMIGGASIGSFIVANSMGVIKSSAAGFMKVIKGPKYKSQDYMDLLSLMYEITRGFAADPTKLSAHIDDPHASTIFSRYPRLQADHHMTDFICDIYRSVILSTGSMTPMQVEEDLDKGIKKHHHESMEASHAIQTMADGLPAIGIVAAVLGVIKTMASIDKPPAVLGAMIGGALVGTFLGVFLSYCMVMPVAGRLKQIEEEDGAMFIVARNIIVSSLSGQKPVLAVEAGRKAIPSHMQPNFAEVEQAQADVPNEL
jgi:chemotaxis protein MotA